MKDLIRDNAVAFIGDAAHRMFRPKAKAELEEILTIFLLLATAGAYGAGCSFAFGDVRALYLSLWRTHAPNASAADASAYDIPYALHLYNETRRYFLQRVEQQTKMDKVDIAYVAAALDEQEWIRRYRERFTINW